MDVNDSDEITTNKMSPVFLNNDDSQESTDDGYEGESDDSDEEEEMEDTEGGEEDRDSGSSETNDSKNISAIETSDVDDVETKTPSESLASVMSSILGRQPGKQKIILAKAKTDKQLLLAKRKAEDDSDDAPADGETTKRIKVEIKTEIKSEFDRHKERELKKKLWTNANRVKPHVADKEKERNLQRIATRGVVQLFNAVAKQQKLIDDQMKEAGSSERKRDNVLQGMTKGKFMDVLRSTAGNANTCEKKPKVEVKTETEEAAWRILRDDFMMGAKMKDWDKLSDSDDQQMDVQTDINS